MARRKGFLEEEDEDETPAERARKELEETEEEESEEETEEKGKEKTGVKVLVVPELPTQPVKEVTDEKGKKFKLMTISEAIGEIRKDLKELLGIARESTG